MPDLDSFCDKYKAVTIEMMQTYLSSPNPDITRRIRQQRSGSDYLYLYTEKRRGADGKSWVTERPISQKEYISYLMEADLSLHAVRKTKYRFNYREKRMEIDVYPFSREKAVLFVYGISDASPVFPPELRLLQDVTGLPDYKNIALARSQTL